MQSHSTPNHEEYVQSEPDQEWEDPVADPVLAEVARRGGERLVEFITEWLGGVGDGGGLGRPLESSYGWIARVKRQSRDWDLWFQPAAGGRALWLVLPGPAWSMSELLEEVDEAHHSLEHRVVLIEPLSPLEPFAHLGYDGVLFGVCSSPVSDVGIGTQLLSRAEYGLIGQELWAAVVNLPPFV